MLSDKPISRAIPRMHFEVAELRDDHWFRLIGDDGELLLSGGPRRGLDACLDCIDRLKATSRDTAWFHARRSPSGAHYFTIDVGAAILATSHLYDERRVRDLKMALVRQWLVDAPVIVRGLHESSRDDTEAIALDETLRPSGHDPQPRRSGHDDASA